MQGDHRQLHGERDDKSEQDPKFNPGRQLRAKQIPILECVHACRLMMHEVECKDGDQHQQSAELREEQELNGGVNPSLVTPDRDQEIHGDQHQLPRKIKQEQVEGEKHACDSRQHPHEIEVEKTDLVVDLCP